MVLQDVSVWLAEFCNKVFIRVVLITLLITMNGILMLLPAPAFTDRKRLRIEGDSILTPAQLLRGSLLL